MFFPLLKSKLRAELGLEPERDERLGDNGMLALKSSPGSLRTDEDFDDFAANFLL